MRGWHCVSEQHVQGPAGEQAWSRPSLALSVRGGEGKVAEITGSSESLSAFALTQESPLLS